MDMKSMKKHGQHMMLPSEVLTPVTSPMRMKLISLLHQKDNYFVAKDKISQQVSFRP